MVDGPNTCPVEDAIKMYEAKADWDKSARMAVEYLTIVDAEFRVVYVNHTQPGLPDPRGCSCLDFVDPDHRDVLKQAIENTRATGMPHHFETNAVGPNGEVSYYSGWTHRLEMSGLCHVVIVGTDVTHLRRIEEKLEVSDETLRALVTNAPDAIGVVERDHRLAFINRPLLRSRRVDLVEQRLEQYFAGEEAEKVYAAIEQAFETGESCAVDAVLVDGERGVGDGQRVDLAMRFSPIKVHGKITALSLISTDHSERRRAEATLRATEAQLRQSQKLQAIGQLTGGIAHDFNNLLMVMSGSLEQARLDSASPGLVAGHLEEALNAVDRASSLTHRLLAFGRRQTLRPVGLNAGELLLGMQELLVRTLGAHMEIAIDVETDQCDCAVDRDQLENAVLNLAINARDALGEKGGRLGLRASARSWGADDVVRPAGLEPGDYVCVCVEDDGPGMDADTLARAFEPFFTTKSVGRGSGLGLSMVYGFAQQSGGAAVIDSELGRGTRVLLYLPRTGQLQRNRSAPCEDSATPQCAGERVLLVEDQPSVARTAAQLLARLGYRVSTVQNARMALEQLGAHDDIEILVTDIGLPEGPSGVELAAEAAERWPELRILLVTGYEDRSRGVGEGDGVVDRGSARAKLQARGVPVLRKPFRLSELARALRSVRPVGAMGVGPQSGQM